MNDCNVITSYNHIYIMYTYLVMGGTGPLEVPPAAMASTADGLKNPPTIPSIATKPAIRESSCLEERPFITFRRID